MAMGDSNNVHFTMETAKAALTDILATLNNEENLTKLEEAKENVGNDMLKMMQYIFPLVVQIQMDVIKKYGFTDNREGIIQFTQHIVAMEKEDPCIADLHSQLRAIFLPPVSIATDASL